MIDQQQGGVRAPKAVSTATRSLGGEDLGELTTTWRSKNSRQTISLENYMKRKLTVLFFIFVLALISVSPVIAEGDQVHGAKGAGLVKQEQVVQPLCVPITLIG